MKHLFRSRTTNDKLQQNEMGISRHLPFAYLDNQGIVRTKQGDYCVVLKIEGLSWTTLDDHEVNFEQTLRAKLFAIIADPRFALYHTIIRSKVSPLLNAKYDGLAADLLHQDYVKQLQDNNLFTNDLYLTIVLKGSGSKGNRISSRINHWLSSLSHHLNQQHAQIKHEDAIKLINEVTLRITTSLQKYQVYRLGIHKTERGIFAEPLQFFSRILNWENHPVLAIPADIANYLPKRRLFFGYKDIESRGNNLNETKYASMLSLKEYPTHTYPGMLDELLQLPIEMVITQSLLFQHAQTSRESLELQLRRLQQARDPDQKGIALLEQALGDLVGGEFRFGYQHFTVMIVNDDLTLLEKNIADVTKHLSECGIIAIREHLNLEAAFWAQFPGNFRYIVRKALINTNNFASLCSLNNSPVGHRDGNHWGEAVTILKTTSQAPYYFNFHPFHSDVGHTLIMGMTGSGKTLLTCFLIAQALKFNTRVFYFDKDRGAETFMRGIGADYSLLGHGVSSGLNPLQLPDTRRNRRFLVNWLASLLNAWGDVLNSSDIEVIHHAVRLNYEQLKPHQRTLANLADAFGRRGPGTLRSRIDQWHSDGALADYFGAEHDQLKLTNRFYCFEMGELLDKSSELARPSVLFYLFFRIQLALDENPSHTPTIICLDEAWALLDNAIFATHIKNWLKTFRKRNAIVLLLSQEVTDVSKASISESINAETVTKIFFPDNNPLKEVYRDIFHLSEREIALLQHYSTHNRYFLIKQAQQTTVATLDLSHLTRWIPYLSSNSDTLKLLQQILAKYGANPNQWLISYLEQGQHVKSR